MHKCHQSFTHVNVSENKIIILRVRERRIFVSFLQLERLHSRMGYRHVFRSPFLARMGALPEGFPGFKQKGRGNWKKNIERNQDEQKSIQKIPVLQRASQRPEERHLVPKSLPTVGLMKDATHKDPDTILKILFSFHYNIFFYTCTQTTLDEH